MVRTCNSYRKIPTGNIVLTRPVKLLQKDTQAVLKLKINNKCIDVILSSITAVARKLKHVLRYWMDNTIIERNTLST